MKLKESFEKELMELAAENKQELLEAHENGEDVLHALAKIFMKKVSDSIEPEEYGALLVVDYDGEGNAYMDVPPSLLENEKIVYVDGIPELRVMAIDAGEAWERVEGIFKKYAFSTGFPLNYTVGRVLENGEIEINF